jgi:hypothetical protein
MSERGARVRGRAAIVVLAAGVAVALRQVRGSRRSQLITAIELATS